MDPKQFLADDTKTVVDPALQEIGEQIAHARRLSGLTQQQVANLAGISRPRFRDVEKGVAAARTSTLLNIARAVGLEVMLVPQLLMPAVRALLQEGGDDDQPAFFVVSDDGPDDGIG